jgi:microsomal dipeptidase-like Zn-dependent dipeptidase
MIADLHCHFPMHLVRAQEERLPTRARAWLSAGRRLFDGEGFELAACLFNRSFRRQWRVDLDGLRRGGAGIVCSVLYWPFSEFELRGLRAAPPNWDAFGALMDQLGDVEAALRGRDVAVVKCAEHLDRAGIRFVHCVEGGMHLGPEPHMVDGQVKALADAGVAYITVAHLLYRRVAANAPALPLLSDRLYNRLFQEPDPGEGLTDLGRAVIKAMCDHKVMVDLSHMREDAIRDTLDELDLHDRGREIPVIASHAGIASAGPRRRAYNLTEESMQAIHARGGVIGLITGQHLIGRTFTRARSRARLGEHVEAIRGVLKSSDNIAIGSDLDGFINPTLRGLDTAADLGRLEAWVREICDSQDEAEQVLHGNVERVLHQTFALRARGCASRASIARTA